MTTQDMVSKKQIHLFHISQPKEKAPLPVRAKLTKRLLNVIFPSFGKPRGRLNLQFCKAVLHPLDSYPRKSLVNRFTLLASTIRKKDEGNSNFAFVVKNGS